MIFEQVLKFFGIDSHQAGSSIETFHTVPEIVDLFQSLYPDAIVEKTHDDAEELGIFIKRKDLESIFIPIRESQRSGYFLIEVPTESSLSK